MPILHKIREKEKLGNVLSALGLLLRDLLGLNSRRIPNTKSRFWCEEKFKNIYSDQIDDAEFEFLGLEIRFERNKSSDFRSRILISDSTRTEF